MTIEFEDRMETNIAAKRACYILMSYNISYPLACFNVILAWQRDMTTKISVDFFGFEKCDFILPRKLLILLYSYSPTSQ